MTLFQGFSRRLLTHYSFQFDILFFENMKSVASIFTFLQYFIQRLLQLRRFHFDTCDNWRQKTWKIGGGVKNIELAETSYQTVSTTAQNIQGNDQVSLSSFIVQHEIYIFLFSSAEKKSVLSTLASWSYVLKPRAYQHVWCVKRPISWIVLHLFTC